MSQNVTTNSNPPANAPTVAPVRRVAVPATKTPNSPSIWPLWYLAGGLTVLFFWLWGNAVQIQTSEAWMMQAHSAISIAPHFAVFAQIVDFWNGNLSSDQVIADSWGWGVQVVLLICSIGVEFPAHAPGHRRLAFWFGLGCFACVLLNSIADFNFSGLGGFWGQLGFVGICFMMSFFFGMLAIHLIGKGIALMMSA